MNNYKYLIIFVQKIESLTANSIFHQLVWWCHQWWHHSISVKRCLHYRGTVVQKHLAIGRGVKILDQKNWGGVQRTPPASLRVNQIEKNNIKLEIICYCNFFFLNKIGVSSSAMCTFCNEYVEMLEHVFWECKFSQSFWKNVTEWLTKNLNNYQIYTSQCLHVSD